MTTATLSQLRAAQVEADVDRELRTVNLPTRLQYALRGYQGSLSQPWLDARVADALEAADAALRRSSRGETRLLVWDALRTRECQREIWNRYAAVLRADATSDLCESELQRRVAQFVSDPSGVFRHGTGGAVDVSLLDRGREAFLGTRFDDFSARAAAGYFDRFPPLTDNDREACRNRRTLAAAMTDAGFVVFPNEWWHWEFGTIMWAAEQDGIPFLTRVVTPPSTPSAPAQISDVRRGLPSLVTGVAQPFSACSDRDHALTGQSPAHYYARTSTPSRSALEKMLAAIC